MTQRAVAMLWLVLLCEAVVAAPDNDAAERARIAADRQVVEARYREARRACETRFVVIDCQDRARQARREALAPLQRQSHLLDDARRRERAIERMRVIQARESAAAAMPALQAASAAAPPASQLAPRPLVLRAVRAATAASATELAARQRATQYQQRQLDAQARQEAVRRRNANRDAIRQPAAGLPVPGASAP